MVFRTRGLLVRQRTQTVNALRGHLAEFGLVAPRGVANVEQLWEAFPFAECAETLPELVVTTAGLLFDRIDELNAQLDEVDKQMRSIAREDEELRRLMTIPGVGEVGAMAVHAFAPAMESFDRGLDFAAWIGLTPREVSTGGRQRLGRITKMGQRDLRQLVVCKRYGSDLTKTIRARGRQGLHREAGHTTVPDPHAAHRSKSCLPIRGASTYGSAGAPGFQGEAGVKAQGRSSSMFDAGGPAAMASRVASRYA